MIPAIDYGPGDLVVCIDARATLGLAPGLTEGAVYTVAGIDPLSLNNWHPLANGRVIGVALAEVSAAPFDFFAHVRFRKLLTKPQAFFTGQHEQVPA